MIAPKKRKLAQVPEGMENPLNFAVDKRDRDAVAMVQEAVAHKQVLLAYQPIMRADCPDKVAFCEGLVRVLDDTGRVIPARQFVDSIETTELGREIDTIALGLGLRALHLNPTLRLSINMSARSIGYQRWNKTLERWLNKDETIGERLILEMTENSVMMVPELVISFMNRLQALGICFGLDDFGAGQTAIRYFKDMYFDILKIDGQFIRGISGNPDNRALVAAMISIAHHFDMLTVASSVESGEDADLLIEMGIDCLQGFHFGAPSTRPQWLRQAGKVAPE